MLSIPLFSLSLSLFLSLSLSHPHTPFLSSSFYVSFFLSSLSLFRAHTVFLSIILSLSRLPFHSSFDVFVNQLNLINNFNIFLYLCFSAISSSTSFPTTNYHSLITSHLLRAFGLSWLVASFTVAQTCSHCSTSSLQTGLAPLSLSHSLSHTSLRHTIVHITFDIERVAT